MIVIHISKAPTIGVDVPADINMPSGHVEANPNLAQFLDNYLESYLYQFACARTSESSPV